MGRFFRLIFCVFAQGVLVAIFAFFSPIYAQSSTITGPRETPASVPGILVPNPDFGDRIIYPGNERVNVSGRVGEFIIDVTGLASPNASVVIEDESGQFLRATVANAQGYFVISELSVNRGLDTLCFETVDFERLGNSESCLEFEPITESGYIEDVYLPPSIGLFARTINAGQEALIYGYSMPGAEVDVRVKDGLTFAITADNKGYYEYRYQAVPAGKYSLSSIGEFNDLDSLEPKNAVDLEALSIPQQVGRTTGDVVTTTGDLLTNTLLGFLLLLLLLILIIIVILIFIFKPAWARFILDRFKPQYKMHHDWLIAYVEDYEGSI